MRLAIVLPSLVLAISSLSQAQSKTLHQENSQVADARLGSNDGLFADVGCDAKANVFVTVWNPEGDSRYAQGPMFGNRAVERARPDSEPMETSI